MLLTDWFTKRGPSAGGPSRCGVGDEGSEKKARVRVGRFSESSAQVYQIGLPLAAATVTVAQCCYCYTKPCSMQDSCLKKTRPSNHAACMTRCSSEAAHPSHQIAANKAVRFGRAAHCALVCKVPRGTPYRQRRLKSARIWPLSLRPLSGIAASSAGKMETSISRSKQASKQADAHHRAHYPIAACTIVCGFRYPSHLPAAVKVWLSRLLKRSNLWQGENTLLNITVGKFPFTTEFVFFFLLFSLSFSFLSCKSGQFCTSSIHDWPHCQKCDSPSRKRNCTSTVTAFFFLVGFDTISPHSLV